MIETSELRTIWNAVDWPNVPPEVYKKFTEFVEAREELDKFEKERDERLAAAVSTQVPDFSGVKVGTLVVRSTHALQQNSWLKPDIGIITNIKIFEDDLAGVAYWPDVHWEGEIMSKLSHPLNVALRDGTVLPMRTMNANQQTKPKLKTEENCSES